MPDYDHPGFTYWPGNDPKFPIGNVELAGTPGRVGGSATGEIALPQAAPQPKIAAARFIAVEHSCKLWFALECTTNAAGQLASEVVLRGQHLYFWKDHCENEVGPVMEVRLSAAQWLAGGTTEVVADHGHHCDTLFAHWGLKGAAVSCYLSVLHFEKSKRQYLADLEEAARQAETGVYEDVPLPPEPEGPVPVPEPTPEVEPGT
jgi:hypothetical protein